MAAGDDIGDALTRLAREESGRVLALLARQFRSLDLADEAVQDALASAAATWPERGVPTNPPAWLLTVARNKAIDRLRRQASARRKALGAARDLIVDDAPYANPLPTNTRHPMIDEPPDGPFDRARDGQRDGQRDEREGQRNEPSGGPVDGQRDPRHGPADDSFDEPDAADQLRLMLLCCHPALDPPAQVALTLRLVGGLTTTEIAAGLLLQEATLAQRIVRAKRKIRDAGIPLTIPRDLTERLDVVLGVLYLIFNEGYLARTSDAVVRIDLVNEAIRLTEVLASLVDEQPEVLGLLALQRFHRARSATRTDAAGDLILLEDQDRTRWDLADITAAGAALMRALRQMRPGPYQLQAVIARHHAVARTAADTDWPAIAGAYGQLVAMTGSPVIRLNHAVAVAMADGPLAGLAMLERIEGLDGYHLFHAARGELLARAGRPDEASDAFTAALPLTANEAERRHLLRRRAALQSE